MTAEPAIHESELQGFVDGQLSPERRRAVMAHLSGAAEDAGRVSAYHALNEELHLAYDEVLHEPLPARLDVARYVPGDARRSATGGSVVTQMRALLPQAAALGTLALLSGFAGWSLNDRLTGGSIETASSNFTQNAAHAHMLYAPGGKFPFKFGADQKESLLLWLSKSLGTEIVAPSLEEEGYTLVGAWLLPSEGQPAGQLMYQGGGDRGITLYIRDRQALPPDAMTGPTEDTVTYAVEDGVSMMYWADRTLAYALIGQMDREELVTVARLVRDQLHIPAIAPAPPAAESETRASP